MRASRCLSTYCVLGRASTRETHCALRMGDVRGVDSVGWCHAAESEDNPPKTSDDMDRVGRACRGGELPWKAMEQCGGLGWEAGGNGTASAKALGSSRPVLSHEARTAEAKEGEGIRVGGGLRKGSGQAWPHGTPKDLCLSE